MSAILENSKQEDSPTDALNAAMKNIMSGLYELIQTEARAVSQVKEERGGAEIEEDPFTIYQIEQELMGYTIGILNNPRLRHVFQLEAHFSNFVIDKMLPTLDAQEKGE